MQLAPIIQHLQQAVPALKQVGGAMDLATLTKGALASTPAAFVMPLADQAGPNQLATVAVLQRIEHRFAIVIAVRHAGDARGESAYDGGLHVLRTAITGALLGWAPSPELDQVSKIDGKMMSISNNVIWWADQYRTASYVRSV